MTTQDSAISGADNEGRTTDMKVYLLYTHMNDIDVNEDLCAVVSSKEVADKWKETLTPVSEELAKWGEKPVHIHTYKEFELDDMSNAE
jgi:hypothetical protein